jgi:hypothetical protein
MSIHTEFQFNRNEQCTILSPDFLSLTDAKLDTDNFIDSGIFVDINGDPCTIEKADKWFGLVTEANFYNTAGGKVLKPAGNVVSYFGNMRFVTKLFTDNADAPIKKGDLLTIIDGKPAKTDDNHTVPVMQVIYRTTDYIECVTI